MLKGLVDCFGKLVETMQNVIGKLHGTGISSIIKEKENLEEKLKGIGKYFF